METKSILYKRLLCFLFLFAILCPAATGKIIYVDDGAIGYNDGTSWENAYTFLQDALVDAKDSDKPVEIQVAQGVYKPNQGFFPIDMPGGFSYMASFKLINDVSIRGGYAGITESDPNRRNIELYETILSGDLNGDDIEVTDPCEMLRNALSVNYNRGDNSNTIMRSISNNETAIIDGFTVIGGHDMSIAMDGPTGGAGISISRGNPTIINCTFINNAAFQAGGAMHNIASSPTLINCKFEKNYADRGAAIYNGKIIYLSQRCKPKLINCTFINNYAWCGGGIYNFKSDPNLINCIFSYNFVLGTGAGIFNSYSNSELINCEFIENTAGSGGGIYTEDNSSLKITNCIFGDNIARVTVGGGMSISEPNNIVITNSIFSGNSANWSGGGLASHDKLILNDCIFSGNKAFGDQIYAGRGGGLYAYGNPTLINCQFCENFSTEGAGMYINGEAQLDGCFFSGNVAEKYGGGMCNYNNGPEHTITNCIFVGNSAESGGGIFNTWGARFRMANCTFKNNFASNGNALAIDPYLPSLTGYIKLINCIIWDGNNSISDPAPHALSSGITYSNVQGGWEGEGNIDVDPLFANPGYWANVNDLNIIVEPNNHNAVWIEGDYHLKSQGGRFDPVNQIWIRDDVTSPCIDAGDPNSLIGDEPEPNGGIINIGAYGGTAEASKSVD